MSFEINMLTNVKKFLHDNQAARVLVAVSGGVDSMVLLNLALKIIDHDNLAVVNVDHDLRPESQSEVRFVADFCQEHGIKFFTSKWDHQTGGSGMEAAAREFRYRFFDKIMSEYGYDTLLTAHHANDLAENILMKMIRSGNVYEVTSLKKKRNFSTGQLLRPLLDYSKADLKYFAKVNDIKHVQDETNFENITMRNRLRNQIFPQLHQENGQLLEHFTLFDQQLTALIDLATSQFLQIEKAMHFQKKSSGFVGNIAPVKQLEKAQQTLFWGSLFTRKLPDISISNKQIGQIISVISGDKPNASLNLEAGWIFVRSYDDFLIKKSLSTKKARQLDIKIGHEYQFNGKTFKLMECQAADADFWVEKMPKQITLRTRASGDKLALNHENHQKLSKRFINKKIPNDKRNELPILLFDNQIVWVEKIYNISDYLKKGNKFFKIDFN